MNNRQNVPGIARGPQNFSQRNLPPISNPMGQPPIQDPPGADVVSIEDELAMEIYVRLAFDSIATSHIAKPELLHTLAQAAKQAAAIYFGGQTNNG